MGSPSAEFEELRQKAESHLVSTGSAQEVKAYVMMLAEMALPLTTKYQHIDTKTLLLENTAGQNREEALDSLGKMVKALNVLEKYGCNLTNPTRPKYWRTVKHNNPIFRSTVDAMKRGRDVLHLYGYTTQLPDGLSYPDEVTEPDIRRVAAVAIEVMVFRAELDLLVKGSHPHSRFFESILPFLGQQKHETEGAGITSDAVIFPSTKTEETKSEPPAPPPKPKVKFVPVRTPPPVPAPRQMLRPKQTEPPATPCSPSTPTACDMCGEAPSFICSNCGSLPYCERCDAVVHRHPEKVAHKRDHISPSQKENCAICGLAPVAANCPTCAQRLCTECDKLRHSHPDRKGHRRMPVNITTSPESLRLSFSSWECTQCSTVNHARAVTCRSCGRPPLGNASPAGQEASSPSTPSEWECKSCTMVNSGTSVLCEVCERPRLATRPPITPEQLFPPKPNPPVDTEAEWTCKHCTFVNSSPGAVCEMCNLSRNEPVMKTNKSPPLENTMQHFEKPQVPPRQVDLKRQESMRNEGLTLIRYIRDGEKRGISPEEVYAALNISGGSNVDPFDWLQSELPHLLDEICAVVASIQDNKTAKDGQPQSGEVLLSRAEAKQAWLDAGGNTEKAVQKLLKSRQAKTRELQSLGFTDQVKCEEALRVSGGDLNGALTHLQHPLLEPLRQRIWSEQTEIIIDPKDPDKEKTCRRLLALYDLPSWGRCELAWSLLQEPGAEYTLDDVVQAVKQHHDRDFVRRMLVQDCAICYCNFPFSKMASLISCQCSICNECFQEHFTVAVKDKHIRDMVCPACGEPDINDPEALYNYFSILDSQLKNCLKRDVHELFMKKLAEYTLMQDPKFLWCSHCTNGFIYDGMQLKVTCQACHKSFCSQCKKPWEDQHENVTCEQFQTWKRENDPEYQRQGLAGYIRDNGIKCPGCGFQYALAKGGCMHFTCSQCRHEFCSGCNGPYHKRGCPVRECTMQNGLHAHHPRDCLFYLRDWEPPRLQALLQKSGVEFNTEPPNGIQTGECGVMEQKDEAEQHVDSPCGREVALGHAGLCDKHYREYLVSLINEHALDPAPLFDKDELVTACKRYYIDHTQEDNEDDVTYHNRLLQKLMELPLGEKIPRKK